MEPKDYVLAGVASILTILLSKGGPIVLRLLSLRSADMKTRDELQANGFTAVICRLDARVAELISDVEELREELKKKSEEHQECLLAQERLKFEIDMLKKRFEMQGEVSGGKIVDIASDQHGVQ